MAQSLPLGHHYFDAPDALFGELVDGALDLAGDEFLFQRMIAGREKRDDGAGPPQREVAGATSLLNGGVVVEFRDTTQFVLQFRDEVKQLEGAGEEEFFRSLRLSSSVFGEELVVLSNVREQAYVEIVTQGARIGYFDVEEKKAGALVA